MAAGKPKILEMNIETFSDVDLIKCGVYAYADSSAFEVLLFAYSFDGGETRVIDLAQGEELPGEVAEAVFDGSVVKTAFNANFERTCLSKHFGRYLPPDSWHCSAVQAAVLALPRSLEDVGAVLGLDERKMKEGKELIRYFCVPCKPTKANGGRRRNLPCHAPEKWELFKAYCMRDVDVEKAIRRKLCKFPIPEGEMELYRLDQRINDRGVLVDMGLVRQAVVCERLHKEVVTKRAYELTGLENPNSVAQLKGWLGENGVEAESLSKKAVAELKGLDVKLADLYQDAADGILDNGDYLLMRKEFLGRKEKLGQERERLLREMEKCGKAGRGTAEARLRKWLSAGKLDRQMAECFVEEVRVFKGRRLEASLLGRGEILRRMEG